jgi:hypothetical protein
MSRTDISGRLKDSGRAISGPRTRMQSALVMGEMATALVLLVGAGLMCRHFGAIVENRSWVRSHA